MNILLSYPRSGNTWIRYCIEHITKLPTIGYTVPGAAKFDKPLGSLIPGSGVNTDMGYILYKRHETEKLPDNIRLVLIIRNYKEVIIRHKGNDPSLENLISACKTKEPTKNYIQMIEYFDQFDGDKLLIYYEDIITDLENTLVKLLSFLGVSDTDLPTFMLNIEDHKQKCINIYGDSRTRGVGVISHSNKLTIEQKNEWDNWLRTNYGEISEKYLSRYYER